MANKIQQKLSQSNNKNHAFKCTYPSQNFVNHSLIILNAIAYSGNMRAYHAFGSVNMAKLEPYICQRRHWILIITSKNFRRSSTDRLPRCKNSGQVIHLGRYPVRQWETPLPASSTSHDMLIRFECNLSMEKKKCFTATKYTYQQGTLTRHTLLDLDTNRFRGF